MTTTVLVLGGTTEGYSLAERLAGNPAWHAISSLAGRVANPRLPAGEFRIGGFGGPEGLANYLRERGVAAVIDATHPFAARMGGNAAQACAAAKVPLLRLERPAWTPQTGDRWDQVEDWPQAAELVGRLSRRVLMAVGRQELSHFEGLDHVWFLIRAVDRPDPMPGFARVDVVLARGPFRLDGELALLREHDIDTIVCKNSGGSATDAKLAAARELGIRVVMKARPVRPATATVADVAAALRWLEALRA